MFVMQCAAKAMMDKGVKDGRIVTVSSILRVGIYSALQKYFLVRSISKFCCYESFVHQIKKCDALVKNHFFL